MNRIKSAFLLLFLIIIAGCQINDEKMKGFITAEISGSEELSLTDNNARYESTSMGWGDLRSVRGSDKIDQFEYTISVEINDYGNGQTEFDLSEYQNGNIILQKRDSETGDLLEGYTFPQEGMITLSEMDDDQIAGSFYGVIANADASSTISVTSGTFALQKEVVGTVE